MIAKPNTESARQGRGRHTSRRSTPRRGGAAYASRHSSRRTMTREGLDDGARWLDGQVQAWAAARAI